LKSECFPQLRFKAIEVSLSGVSDLFAQQLRPCGGRQIGGLHDLPEKTGIENAC
jgi:hypothetical protein